MPSYPSASSRRRNRDEADHTYADSGPEPSVPDTTPSKRQERMKALSAAAKRRVDGATADMDNRCLITNCLPHYAVDYAHVLPRAMGDTILTRLEFAWGLPWASLNVDTRFNIFRLRTDVHALFDKGWIMLVPEQGIVEKYADGGRPDFNEDRTNNVRYNYTLVALPEMDEYPLHRVRFPGQPGERQEFVFPFSGFPTLQSHVHPCFAICHAGHCVKRVLGLRTHIDPGLLLRITSMREIYSIWTTTEPDMAFYEQPRAPRDEDHPSESGWTRTGRVDEPPPRRSLRLQDKNRQVSPSEGRGGNKRQRADNQRDCHDDIGYQDHGLRALKADLSHPHTYKRKRGFVLDWVSSVAGQTFVEDDTMILQKSQTHDDEGVNAFKGFNHTPPDISVH